mmetsp:Transcript_143583/g.400222  ORF Transcript_143583/g.400222 Transcript_143583/m.400222 type:complete len:434 (-) Transcript_143583:13-1314(-)
MRFARWPCVCLAVIAVLGTVSISWDSALLERRSVEEPLCRQRPTAAELLGSEVTVAFPRLGRAGVYWPNTLAPFFHKIEPAYEAQWAKHGVKTVLSLNATFIVSKQHDTTALTLCNVYPRHQVFNHLPGLEVITVKSRLASTMRTFAQAHPHRSAEIQRLTPASFRLADPRDCNDFRKQVNDSMWIQKRDYQHNSRGIHLLSPLEAAAIAQNCSSAVGSKHLVQRYLPNPLLVNGHKCDLRVYLYIPVTVPFLAFYAPRWYVKCGHERYNASSRDLKNIVTNTKLHGKVREGADYSELVLGPEQLQEHLQKQGIPADFVNVTLKAQIKAKLGLLMEAVVESVKLPETGYELMGCDMMLDSELNLWLIEVNMSPGLVVTLAQRKRQAVELMLPAVVGMQLDLLRFAATGRDRRSLSPSTDFPSKGSLELVYPNS